MKEVKYVLQAQHPYNENMWIDMRHSVDTLDEAVAQYGNVKNKKRNYRIIKRTMEEEVLFKWNK